MTNRVETDCVVLGAGPGGYVAAIRLGQLGVKTLLVEAQDLGGVCLNVGCIPSKALVSASKLVARLRDAEAMGIHVDGVRVDMGQLMAWKGEIVAKLTGGVGQLVRGNGAAILRGRGRFAGPHELDVTEPDGTHTIVHFQRAILATGSRPASVPGFQPDGERVVGATEALSFAEVPARLVVIGGGYIGMELGGVYQRLGAQVTVVEALPRALAAFERDLARPVLQRFQRDGGRVLTNTRAEAWRPADGGGVVVHVRGEGPSGAREEDLQADVILVTVGRKPVTAGLGLERLGVGLDDAGFVEVDGAQRTNLPHVFAIGDVAGEPMLAHKASKEGEVAAEVVAGHSAAFDARAVPAAVFTDPEIATVGMGRRAAKEAGYTPVVGKFPFAANGRALSLHEADGFVRVIMDRDSHLLLGVEAVGPEVSNLVAEAGLALELGALVEDLGLTVHAHPTLSEALMEAANAALGQAIHAMNRR